MRKGVNTVKYVPAPAIDADKWLVHLDALANLDGHKIPETRDMHKLGRWCHVDEKYLERCAMAQTWTNVIGTKDKNQVLIPIDARFEKYAGHTLLLADMTLHVLDLREVKEEKDLPDLFLNAL